MLKRRGPRARSRLLRPIHVNLRKRREQIGLTQAQVADRVGRLARGREPLDPSAVSRWERGLTTPSGEHLPYVAAVLGTSIDKLYEDRA